MQLAFEEVPNGEAYHEITWYINRQMTFEEWVALDDAQADAFEAVGVSMEDVVGIAGPIPFPDREEEDAE